MNETQLTLEPPPKKPEPITVPPGTVIELRKEGHLIEVRPERFLGAELFSVFREATAGARYDRKRKKSLAHLDKIPAILRRLREAGFDARMNVDLVRVLQADHMQRWMDLSSARDRIDAIEKEFHARTGHRFFPFQHTGALWLALKHSALLADEMGCGKSLTAIAAFPSNAPIVVICPASVKGMWMREIEKWRPHIRVTVLKGQQSFRWPGVGEMVVTNYDVLPEIHDTEGTKGRRCEGYFPRKRCPGCAERVTYNVNGIAVMTKDDHLRTCDGLLPPERCPGCHPILDQVAPGTVVLFDEGHRIKSPTAQRTLRARALARVALENKGRAWILTGTPMENAPSELWSVLLAAGAAHEAFGSYDRFLELANGRPKIVTGADGAIRSYGYEWGDPDDTFAEHLRRVSLRRLRADVLPQLPEKMWRRITVDVDKKTLAACDKYLKSVPDLAELLETPVKFETMSLVRKALATAKIPALVKLVEEYEEAGSPMLVFSMHREPIDLLGKRKGWETITGDVDPAKRQRIVEAFQAKGSKLIGVACTITAAGEGLTLTRACREIFVDLSFKPTQNAQAEDRAVRIGQTRGVVVDILEADHELDRRVVEILMQKRRLIATNVDASSARDDRPSIESFEDDLRKIATEIAGGRVVRRGADSEEERRALEGLHALVFEERSDEKLACDLGEQATVIGLSDAQWLLAAKLVSRGIGREEADRREKERLEAIGGLAGRPSPKKEAGSSTAESGAATPRDPKSEKRLSAVLRESGRAGRGKKKEAEMSEKLKGAVKLCGELSAKERVRLILKTIETLEPDERVDLFDDLDEEYCIEHGVLADDCEEEHEDDDEDDDEDDERDSSGDLDDADEEEDKKTAETPEEG